MVSSFSSLSRSLPPFFFLSFFSFSLCCSRRNVSRLVEGLEKVWKKGNAVAWLAQYSAAAALWQWRHLERAADVLLLVDYAYASPKCAHLAAEVALQLLREQKTAADDTADHSRAAVLWSKAVAAMDLAEQRAQGDDAKQIRLFSHCYKARHALWQGNKNLCKRELKVRT